MAYAINRRREVNLMNEKHYDPQTSVGEEEAGLPATPARPFRKTVSQGASVIESTGIYDQGLSPDIIKEIKAQKQSGDFRTIAGRPWWVSTYGVEDLKKAGLV